MSGNQSGDIVKPKLISIVGPNASGKSDAGIALAGKFNGEIISADSRQIYKGMDLGTGKVRGVAKGEMGRRISVLGREFNIVPVLSDGICHWLIDVMSPEEFFTVAEYQALAYLVAEDIIARKCLPIIAGGTGLYIRAVMDGLRFPSAVSNPALREQMEKKTIENLKDELLKMDPKSGDYVDLKNKRRVMRAIEILFSQGGDLSIMKKKMPVFFDGLTLGIMLPREELRKRIKIRLDNRLSEGMIDEVIHLKRNGVSNERLDFFGLEYRFINRHINGEISYDIMYESLYNAICQYAKRQMTWFRKYGNVIWIHDRNDGIKIIERFLSGEDPASITENRS